MLRRQQFFAFDSYLSCQPTVPALLMKSKPNDTAKKGEQDTSTNAEFTMSEETTPSVLPMARHRSSVQRVRLSRVCGRWPERGMTAAGNDATVDDGEVDGREHLGEGEDEGGVRVGVGHGR